eukprot:CAMPEP_0197701710 /NCGR_PEP_ID=MMETSP1338-20131121/123596_1 /TAXON_ID=43686 ORGANISM="Pelagodinium beii, Strain RCC1491" /NCGR_SAMPLE_ID=MMETSP1338 /ASSEMBLY_ACC=CAM_ASM_000754 /LENGTH=162 /DNA_ID=CAMNT_0043285439 /DNA_START=480 /DNA_END=964 /DNA_ORIENTATION=+
MASCLLRPSRWQTVVGQEPSQGHHCCLQSPLQCHPLVVVSAAHQYQPAALCLKDALGLCPSSGREFFHASRSSPIFSRRRSFALSRVLPFSARAPVDRSDQPGLTQKLQPRPSRCKLPMLQMSFCFWGEVEQLRIWAWWKQTQQELAANAAPQHAAPLAQLG